MASIRLVRKENLRVHLSGDGRKWIRILTRKSRSPKVSWKDGKRIPLPRVEVRVMT